jgi:hypothetical protein
MSLGDKPYRFFVDCFNCKARFIVDGIDPPGGDVEVEPSTCPFCASDNLNWMSCDEDALIKNDEDAKRWCEEFNNVRNG